MSVPMEVVEKINLKILDFLTKKSSTPNPFCTMVDIADTLDVKKTDQVGKALRYYHKQRYVEQFSEIDNLKQREFNRKAEDKKISQKSYQITSEGKDVFQKILKACLDEMGQEWLSLKKISSN